MPCVKLAMQGASASSGIVLILFAQGRSRAWYIQKYFTCLNHAFFKTYCEWFKFFYQNPLDQMAVFLASGIYGALSLGSAFICFDSTPSKKLEHIIASCINSSIFAKGTCRWNQPSKMISMGWCKKDVTPLLMHWSNVFLRYKLWKL